MGEVEDAEEDVLPHCMRRTHGSDGELRKGDENYKLQEGSNERQIKSKFSLKKNMSLLK